MKLKLTKTSNRIKQKQDCDSVVGRRQSNSGAEPAFENEESVSWMSGGRELRSSGAEWLEALLPMVLRWAEGSEVDGGGSEKAGRGDDVEEARQLWLAKAMHGIEGEQEEVGSFFFFFFDLEPVELPQNILRQ